MLRMNTSFWRVWNAARCLWNLKVYELGCVQVCPLSSWFLAMHSDRGSPSVYSLALERCNSDAGAGWWWGGKRRQENRAGWMEVLIRLTSRDIWQGPAEKQSDGKNKLYSLQIFLWNLSKPVSTFSHSKAFWKRWGEFPPLWVFLHPPN